MRAVVCHSLNLSDNLQVDDVDEPVVGSDQVVVQVEAVGLSYLDAVFIEGTYQIAHPTPFIPGGEFAGRVVEVGEYVSDFTVGDVVAGESIVGALAERVAVSRLQLTKVPVGISTTLASTVLQSYSTALYALTRRTVVVPGQSLLVLGAGGGVGLACVDVAISLGASVVAVASSPEKRRAATSLGAQHVIDPASEDLKMRTRELFSTGVDVVVDPVGGTLAEPALRALGYGGHYLVVGFASGTIPKIPLNLVLLNNRSVIGVESAIAFEKNPELARSLYDDVMTGLREGHYHPLEPKTVSLAEVSETLRAIRNRQVVGKVAVIPREWLT